MAADRINPVLFLCLLFTTFSTAFAQSKVNTTDKGLVVYTLGSDTTTVQYFEYNNKKFKTTILNLTGQVQKYEGEGILDETGDIKEVKSKLYQINSTGDWFLSKEAINIFNGDSSIYTITSNAKVTSRRAFPGKGIVSNTDPCSFYMFPYMGFFAPKKNKDSLLHCHLVFESCRHYHVTRKSKNELNVGSTAMGNLKLFIDKNSRLESADAIGSSLNFIARVERGDKDYVSYIDRLGKTKFANNSMAKRIIRDTTKIVVNGKKIEVDYWRPMTRGRKIFGAVVPWNRIWRTGANNATQLRSEVVLNFNGSNLPIGKYSIWTYPTETSWYLYLNKMADVWGTEYDANQNAMKLKLNVEKTAEKVEVLKIDLLQVTDKIVRLQIAWDDYKAWTDFSVE